MRYVIGFASVLLFAGCAHTPPIGPRAAFDFGCSESQLQMMQIDERTVGVSGCGKRATYIENCRWSDGYGGKHDCTWVMNASDNAPNSDAPHATAAPAAPTPATATPTPAAPPPAAQ